MPRFIKPMDPPKIRQPSDDVTGEGDQTYRIDDSERFLHDLIAQEATEIIGTECTIWQRSLKKSKVDPLYGEAIETGFNGPFVVRAHFEWPDVTPEATEAGKRQIWPAAIWVARKSLEAAGAGPMDEGNIVRVWDIPYFNNEATLNNPNSQGFFFDVVKVNDDGHINDTASFVGFRCDLKRRSDSPPEAIFHPAKADGESC